MEIRKVYFHLPGLFEFYELYRVFLPLYRTHRDWFYDWCEIGSLYGAPADCLWGGGRTGCSRHTAREVLALAQEYGISARLTFSNSLLREEHLTDPKCNALCAQFAQGSVQNGVIVHSDLLVDYLQEHYPELYLVSSTTKVLTEFAQLEAETARPEFRYVVPDFRLNKAFAQLDSLPQPQKDKLEFLCNECCWFGCTDRRRCYENVSRRNLGELCPEHRCTAPRCGGRLPLFQSNAEPRLYRSGGHPQHLPAHGLFAVQDRGPGSWQCAGAGISAVLSDQTGTPAAGAGRDLPGQYAGPVLTTKKGAERFWKTRRLCAFFRVWKLCKNLLA